MRSIRLQLPCSGQPAIYLSPFTQNSEIWLSLISVWPKVQTTIGREVAKTGGVGVWLLGNFSTFYFYDICLIFALIVTFLQEGCCQDSWWLEYDCWGTLALFISNDICLIFALIVTFLQEGCCQDSWWLEFDCWWTKQPVLSSNPPRPLL